MMKHPAPTRQKPSVHAGFTSGSWQSELGCNTSGGSPLPVVEELGSDVAPPAVSCPALPPPSPVAVVLAADDWVVSSLVGLLDALPLQPHAAQSRNSPSSLKGSTMALALVDTVAGP